MELSTWFSMVEWGWVVAAVLYMWGACTSIVLLNDGPRWEQNIQCIVILLFLWWVLVPMFVYYCYSEYRGEYGD